MESVRRPGNMLHFRQALPPNDSHRRTFYFTFYSVGTLLPLLHHLPTPSLSVCLLQFSSRTILSLTAGTHSPQRRTTAVATKTMTLRDAASLLVGLLVLCHTWGGECWANTATYGSVALMGGGTWVFLIEDTLI